MTSDRKEKCFPLKKFTERGETKHHWWDSRGFLPIKRSRGKSPETEILANTRMKLPQPAQIQQAFLAAI